jgi:hypothetical protein
MTELVLVCVGEKDGLPIFSPLSIEDVKAIGSQTTIACDVKSKKCLRTIQQNRSIHCYLGRLSTALNDAGWDMRRLLELLSKDSCIPWTMNSAKEKLWRKVQDAMYLKSSTTKLEKIEVGKVYEVLDREVSRHSGVTVPFAKLQRGSLKK